mmetsp:Transcript_44393/g.71243  ORF Transcript_44393/g.71243 Transcript_44393/m.71243 type:complete len:156 (-) Transcript_44393:685-1152(-)
MKSPNANAARAPAAYAGSIAARAGGSKAPREERGGAPAVGKGAPKAPGKAGAQVAKKSPQPAAAEGAGKPASRKEAINRGLKKTSERVGKSKDQKTPFHMKQALKKKMDLIEQYNELKSRGALEDFMSKRRKKLYLRDHRLVPRARNDKGGQSDK